MRLISSLTAAAAVLADQAADRLDTWVEHNTGTTDTPRETPLGFTPATGADAPDTEAIINAAADRSLDGDQRARWLAEVKERLDASTGGPWCTEDRDRPTNRITSPYGVIATGVTRATDRDLIEECRADLYGLLALAKHDDEVIEKWSKATADYAARAGNAERELNAMRHRESAVDMVAASWVDGSLKGYRYPVDPGEPAGRVIAAIEGVTASRGKTIRDLQSQVEDLRRADAELGGMHEREAAVELVLDSLVDGRLTLTEYVDPETPAGRVRDLLDTLLTQVRDAEARAALAERKLDAHHRHDAELTTADDIRARAAARIRKAADEFAENVEANPGSWNTGEASAYYEGMSAAASIAADETPEADPNVAHIDTVNGRAPEYTPGPIAEAILATGGTIVVDDNGDPHVTDTPLSSIGPGTLITSDGKRHHFTNSTATPLDDTEDDTDA